MKKRAEMTPEEKVLDNKMRKLRAIAKKKEDEAKKAEGAATSLQVEEGHEMEIEAAAEEERQLVAQLLKNPKGWAPKELHAAQPQESRQPREQKQQQFLSALSKLSNRKGKGKEKGQPQWQQEGFFGQDDWMQGKGKDNWMQPKGKDNWMQPKGKGKDNWMQLEAMWMQLKGKIKGKSKGKGKGKEKGKVKSTLPDGMQRINKKRAEMTQEEKVLDNRMRKQRELKKKGKGKGQSEAAEAGDLGSAAGDLGAEEGDLEAAAIEDFAAIEEFADGLEAEGDGLGAEEEDFGAEEEVVLEGGLRVVMEPEAKKRRSMPGIWG